jgi:hypothetical protein
VALNQGVEEQTMRERVCSIFRDQQPQRIPFIDRMDFWYKHHVQKGTLPDPYRGMTLNELHKAVGIGQEAWQLPYTYRYNNVEVICTINGNNFFHKYEPTLDYFPAIWDMIPVDQVGVTTAQFITPKGKIVVQHEMVERSISEGARSYIIDRAIKEEEDYRIFEFIIEHAEFVPRFEEFYRADRELGDHGFLVPNIERIPFQALLLDALGEINLFYALYDNPSLLERLIQVLHNQTKEKIHKLSDFDVPYVEFVDNLDGFMTNPKLFQKYCLPHYQEYATTLNQQGKKVGSHTDGDLKALLLLIAESGLDVCESFTPSPTTECTFEEAWEAWKDGPIIWGGIPSSYLEERISEKDFQDHVEYLFSLFQNRSVILGIGDAVMSDNIMERVAYIAKKVEEYKPNP